MQNRHATDECQASEAKEQRYCHLAVHRAFFTCSGDNSSADTTISHLSEAKDAPKAAKKGRGASGVKANGHLKCPFAILIKVAFTICAFTISSLI